MNLATLLIGYKKIDTFKLVCDALSKSTYKTDIFVRLDNCNNLEISNKHIEYAKQHLSDSDIKLREQQYGLDLNVVFSVDEIFQKGYDGVFYVEDDIIYDSTAQETMKNLYEWCNENIPNKAGLICGWNHNQLNEETKKYYYKLHGLENLAYDISNEENEIAFSGQNPWGCLITREFYDKCFSDIKAYYLSMIQTKQINWNILTKWLGNVPNSSASIEFQSRVLRRFNPIGWEAIYDLSMLANDLYKIALTNPRIKTIGNIGSTSTDEMFIKCGLDKIQSLNSKIVQTKFKLNEESKKLFLK